MKPMTSQSLPRALLVVLVLIMSHSMDLAGLAHKKSFLTLHQIFDLKL